MLTVRIAHVCAPLVGSVVFVACLAAEPLDWGEIDRTRAGLGRFTFMVTNPPANGRVAVPTGFPQIVQATSRVGGQLRDLPIEVNRDATAICLVVPQAADGIQTIAVQTADETRQFDDGRIVFAARDARVHGEHARLEDAPGNARIGFWTKPTDFVSWTRQATRWGAYEVRLTYSTAAPAGTEIAVDVCGTTLSRTLPSTGSWFRYVTLPLGRVHLSAAGEQVVFVRCTKQAGDAVMNLKAVTLEPTCEGVQPAQAADGTITLHGRDATVRGTMLRYEPAEKKQTLGFWTRSTDAAVWDFTVRDPGLFDVEVLQGCGKGQGGSEMLVTCDPETSAAVTLGFDVQDTGGFQEFQARVVGRVRIATAGDHELRVVPRRIAKAAACDIRQIRLVPARP